MGVHDIRSMIDKTAPELRARGVHALYLFGSEARGDAREDSDIDLAFDVDPDCPKFSLLDQGALQVMLQDRLGRKVDFVERQAMRPRMRARVESEMVRLL